MAKEKECKREKRKQKNGKGEYESRREFECSKDSSVGVQDRATPRGFEPLRANHNTSRVELHDRSDTVACMAEQDAEALLHPRARVEVLI